ncbi:MAG TPA: pyridoxal 5'-phosphate synthase glutaminase subunit PdxT [Acidimicrobiales bacterium]|nr:pyridoxal 5'-phosphate synthase glutaminase subunit PdxT [Acidimicrobiales bacterium]
MKVGVLALQGDVREHAAAIAELGSEPSEVRRPEHLAGIDALVLPGGESTTLSMLLDSSGLRAPIEERIADGLPVMGTCAGMILLASEVIGGRHDQRGFGAMDITVRRNGFGRQAQSFECDLAVEGIGERTLRAVFIRAPVVERVGAAVEVLARVTDGEGASVPVLCRQGRLMATAFHPELSADNRVHALFLSAPE